MCTVKLNSNFLLNDASCMQSLDGETTDHSQSCQTDKQLAMGIPPKVGKPGKPMGNHWERGILSHCMAMTPRDDRGTTVENLFWL
jgi:hypothetical protein